MMQMLTLEFQVAADKDVPTRLRILVKDGEHTLGTLEPEQVQTIAREYDRLMRGP